MVVLDFKLRSPFLEYVKLFYSYIDGFLKDGKRGGNFFEDFI